MTNLLLIYCCFLFQCADSSRFSGFYDVPDIENDFGHKQHVDDFRTPIIQYISTPPLNYTFPKIGFFNTMNTRKCAKSGEFKVHVSSQGDQNLAWEVLLMYTMLHQSSFISNLSLPFSYNNVEYFFGTDRDLSNYSSLSYPLICEYPMARYMPNFREKFYAIEPMEPVTRVFFGCKSSEDNSCCGLECCSNLSLIDIFKTCMYFIGVIIFLIVVCHQISACDKRARNKCAKQYETI